MRRPSHLIRSHTNCPSVCPSTSLFSLSSSLASFCLSEHLSVRPFVCQSVSLSSMRIQSPSICLSCPTSFAAAACLSPLSFSQSVRPPHLLSLDSLPSLVSHVRLSVRCIYFLLLLLSSHFSHSFHSITPSCSHLSCRSCLSFVSHSIHWASFLLLSLTLTSYFSPHSSTAIITRLTVSFRLSRRTTAPSPILQLSRPSTASHSSRCRRRRQTVHSPLSVTFVRWLLHPTLRLYDSLTHHLQVTLLSHLGSFVFLRQLVNHHIASRRPRRRLGD